jgi:hypothetical protein
MEVVLPESVSVQHAASTSGRTGFVVTSHKKEYEHVSACLRSLLGVTTTWDRVVHVYLNEPKGDKMLHLADEFPETRVHVVENQTSGFGLTGTWNAGTRECLDAGCDVVVLVNHDTVVNHSLAMLVAAARFGPPGPYGPTSDQPGFDEHGRQIATEEHVAAAKEMTAEVASPRRSVDAGASASASSSAALSSELSSSVIRVTDFVNEVSGAGLNGFFWAMHRDTWRRNMLAPGLFFDEEQFPFGGNENEWNTRWLLTDPHSEPWKHHSAMPSGWKNSIDAFVGAEAPGTTATRMERLVTARKTANATECPGGRYFVVPQCVVMHNKQSAWREMTKSSGTTYILAGSSLVEEQIETWARHIMGLGDVRCKIEIRVESSKRFRERFPGFVSLIEEGSWKKRIMIDKLHKTISFPMGLEKSCPALSRFWIMPKHKSSFVVIIDPTADPEELCSFEGLQVAPLFEGSRVEGKRARFVVNPETGRVDLFWCAWNSITAEAVEAERRFLAACGTAVLVQDPKTREKFASKPAFAGVDFSSIHTDVIRRERIESKSGDTPKHLVLPHLAPIPRTFQAEGCDPFLGVLQKSSTPPGSAAVAVLPPRQPALWERNVAERLARAVSSLVE